MAQGEVDGLSQHQAGGEVLYLGIDLAWAEGTATRRSNESGVVALNGGDVLHAGWTRGPDETVEWIDHVVAERTDVLLFVDAPLVVNNPTGQRLCEKQVGQRYGRWKVSANTTNVRSPRVAGVRLRERLEGNGWRYDDGTSGPPASGRVLSECYPYTTLVGAHELGYDHERPRYKRKPSNMRIAEFRPQRAAACDEMIRRLHLLEDVDPPLRLRAHSETQRLLDEPSPESDVEYKHREDLIDAVLCAWTAALWHRQGLQRCQVLGADSTAMPSATIIAPARAEQRRTGANS
jgi:predicted RNase H-like nuclease